MTCNRVAIINRGKVVATNIPENLMAQLAGGSGYELEIDGDATAAQQLLQVLPGVRLIESIPSIRADADTPILENRTCLRVISEPGAEPGRDIIAVLVGMEVGVYEMRRTQATLEDVFLELTTEEKNLDAAADSSKVELKETKQGEAY